MPKRLRRFCHGFANPSLPRSPSAIFLFFLLWWLRLSVVKKNKKASSTFLVRSLRRFILNTDAIAKTACSLCAPCCCLAALAQPNELFLCEPLVIASLCLTTQKAATLCCGLHGLPLAVPLRCTFKSGQAIPALTQQVKGAGGVAGQQWQQEVNS